MKKQKFFAGAIGALMLLCLPSCGQNTPPTEETALSRQTPAKGRIAEIILDGTASRMPVSASISTGTGAAAFQITDKTLFLDGQTGQRLPASDLLEERDACIIPAEDSQPPYAEAVLLHLAEQALDVHLHTVEETAITENGLLITTDGGSLHLYAPCDAALTFYADGTTATLKAIQIGDRVFAWYDGVEETYPAQAHTERLVIVPTLPALPETLPEGISLSVLPGSVTPCGASFRLFHNTNAELQFGAAYTLQKLQNGEWSNLPYAIENGAFTMEAYNLPKGEPQTLTVSWGWLYGELPPGEYRLVKTVSDFRGTGDYDDYTLTAEFTIGEFIACN